MPTQSQAFLDAVEHECRGLTVSPGCRGSQCEYAEGDENHQCEASFSSSECDSCGSRLGGDRHPATALDGDLNIYQRNKVRDGEIVERPD